MGEGVNFYDASCRMAEERDEEELTTFMRGAARRYNVARLEGGAISELNARRAEEQLKIGMLALMYRLRLSPQEYDAQGRPRYQRNKLWRALITVRVTTESGETVGLDEVEAWDIAQQELDLFHRDLVEEVLENESAFRDNLAPLIHSWLWRRRSNALGKARVRARKKGTYQLVDLSAVLDGEDPFAESLLADRETREDLFRAASELGPMHQLVYLLGYGLDGITPSLIPPKEISDLVTCVLDGECETVDGMNKVVDGFNDGRRETIGVVTLRKAIMTIKVVTTAQPTLKRRRWTKENVRRIADQVREQVAAVIGDGHD